MEASLGGFLDGPCRWQTKRAEQLRVAEEGQDGDRVVLKREQLNRVSPPFGLVSVANVQSEGRLPVRGGGNEAERSGAHRPPGPREKRPDRLASLIPLPPGRHTQDRILLEQGDEAVEIGAFPGLNVAFEKCGLLIIRYCPLQIKTAD
jgi:hypothetical protein